MNVRLTAMNERLLRALGSCRESYDGRHKVRPRCTSPPSRTWAAAARVTILRSVAVLQRAAD
jgi:hypothetical protein